MQQNRVRSPGFGHRARRRAVPTVGHVISSVPAGPRGPASRRVGRRVLAATRALTTPLLPDDYLALVNPLWSARELRGRVVAVRPVGPATTELTIRPGVTATDHVPGQHVGIGVEIGGRWHWRTYSPTSLPGDPLTIAVTAVPDGSVSPHLARVTRPGDVLRLGPPAGDLTLDASRGPLLLVCAGSGITPVLGMLRALTAEPRDVVVVHGGHDADALVHGPDLRALAGEHPWLRVLERHTGVEGRLTVDALRALVPDWRARTAYVCGPAGLVDAVVAHHEAAGVAVHHERFTPPTPVAVGTGGTVTFSGRGVRTTAVAGPATPLLHAGEEAGALLPSGCRMGICRTCVGRLAAGAVHDLQTGERHEAGPDQTVRTCVSAAAGDVRIEYP